MYWKRKENKNKLVENSGRDMLWHPTLTGGKFLTEARYAKSCWSEYWLKSFVDVIEVLCLCKTSPPPWHIEWKTEGTNHWRYPGSFEPVCMIPMYVVWFFCSAREGNKSPLKYRQYFSLHVPTDNKCVCQSNLYVCVLYFQSSSQLHDVARGTSFLTVFEFQVQRSFQRIPENC